MQITQKDRDEYKFYCSLKDTFDQQWDYKYTYKGIRRTSSDRLKDIVYQEMEGYIEDVELLEGD